MQPPPLGPVAVRVGDNAKAAPGTASGPASSTAGGTASGPAAPASLLFFFCGRSAVEAPAEERVLTYQSRVGVKLKPLPEARPGSTPGSEDHAEEDEDDAMALDSHPAPLLPSQRVKSEPPPVRHGSDQGPPYAPRPSADGSSKTSPACGVRGGPSPRHNPHDSSRAGRRMHRAIGATGSSRSVAPRTHARPT